MRWLSNLEDFKVTVGQYGNTRQEQPTWRELRVLDQLTTKALVLLLGYPPGGSGWIISVGYYADKSFAALESSDPREVRLELQLGFFVFDF